MAKNNLKSVLNSLKKFGEEAEQLVEDTTIAVASEIEADAKRKAPVDMGFLRNQIYSNKVDKLNWEVIAGAPYSAYMEFGTGGKVDLSHLTQAGYPTKYAEEFQGNGIREVTMAAQPFLFPAFNIGKEKYLDDLTDLLNDLTKKYN